jgi:hypothetical protein
MGADVTADRREGDSLPDYGYRLIRLTLGEAADIAGGIYMSRAGQGTRCRN